jgi:hypothetical protein
MSPEDRTKLQRRVIPAAEAALASNGYVTAIDVLTGVGWLAPSNLAAWRQGRVPYLEKVVNAKLGRISAAIEAFRAWASEQGLNPSETAYLARTSSRETLRFSASGNDELERSYRTHFVSPKLSEKKKERLSDKANKPPELVVVSPLNRDWKCHRCGKEGVGNLLLMENGGPACMRCVGLDDLEFLPRGDASLTRKVKAISARLAVVARFSRARKRYERLIGALPDDYFDVATQAPSQLRGGGSCS